MQPLPGLGVPGWGCGLLSQLTPSQARVTVQGGGLQGNQGRVGGRDGGRLGVNSIAKGMEGWERVQKGAGETQRCVVQGVGHCDWGCGLMTPSQPERVMQGNKGQGVGTGWSEK